MIPGHSGELAAGSGPQIEPMPGWPARTIAVLATVGSDGPHAIPVSAPVGAGDRSILLGLHRTRGSLERLRGSPQVALVILAAVNVAFTARGQARVLQQPMAVAPDYAAAIAIDVEQIDDHRQRLIVAGWPGGRVGSSVQGFGSG